MDVRAHLLLRHGLAALRASEANWIGSINNSYDTFTWERMVAIKQRILRIWDDAESTVRICCIKFAQRVVLAQSAANPNEPRVR